MFNKIQQLIEEQIQDVQAASRDLEEGFGDPLARQTRWTPARSGGTKGRSRRLVKSGSDRLTFRPTKRKVLLCALFVLIGAYVILFQPVENSEPAWSQSAVGLVFLVMGLVLGYRASTPVVVDKRLGACWTGWRAPSSAEAAQNQEGGAKLSDVRAVQVLPERLRNTEATSSYEINLVLADSSRVNLVDHSSKSVIREDAQTLGKFLDVPVWDASNFPPDQIQASLSGGA